MGISHAVFNSIVFNHPLISNYNGRRSAVRPESDPSSSPLGHPYSFGRAGRQNPYPVERRQSGFAVTVSSLDLVLTHEGRAVSVIVLFATYVIEE